MPSEVRLKFLGIILLNNVKIIQNNKNILKLRGVKGSTLLDIFLKREG